MISIRALVKLGTWHGLQWRRYRTPATKAAVHILRPDIFARAREAQTGFP
jgi:hypothetical protein